MSALGNLEKMPAYIPESRNLKRVYEKKRHDLLRSDFVTCRKQSLSWWVDMMQLVCQSIVLLFESSSLPSIRSGKLQIVAFLSKLPKTEHDLSTFTLDVPFTRYCLLFQMIFFCYLKIFPFFSRNFSQSFFSPSLMTFTVTGLFRERDTRLKECIRHFNRFFNIGQNHAE